VSVVLVAATRGSSPAERAALWAELRAAAARAASGQPIEEGRAVDGVLVRALPADPDAIVRELGRILDEGPAEIAVLPVDVAIERATAPDPALAGVAAAVAEVAARHPEANIRSVGPPFDPAALEAVVELLRGTAPHSGIDDEGLIPTVLARAFRDDPATLAGFLAALRVGLPPDTRIALRGSAVAGASYNDALPFDSRGQGASDLDIVVLGDGAMDLWTPDAFYFPRVNTLPLSDETTWVAPPLDPARVEAQAVVGRPVAVQAMAPWFLVLRAALQGQPYLVLHDPG
jgi:hypothetical protein